VSARTALGCRPICNANMPTRIAKACKRPPAGPTLALCARPPCRRPLA
jgi:hypothetical protein